MLSAGSSIAWL